MALPVTITGISTAVAQVGPFANNVEVNYWDHTSVATFGASASANAKFGLPFTTVSANRITDVGFWLYKVGATDDVLVSLYAADGSNFPTGSALATATIPNATIASGARAFTRVVFPTPVAVSSATTYVVVLERSGAINGSQYFLIGYNGFEAAYPIFIAHDGTSWANHATNGRTCLVVGTSVNSAFYFFGRNGTTATTLSAFKSTAPDTSWASAATKTGFTTAILGLSAYQVGSVIHIAVMDGTASTSVAHKYVSYDMATDTFLASIETISAAQATTGQIAGAGAANSTIVRGNGEVVVFYSGLQTKTSGTFRSRVYYRRRTALNTWSTETQVDANAAADCSTPTAVLGAADRVHFFWTTATSTGYRTLSAANALSTANSSASMAGPGDGCSYVRSGTTKVVVTSNGTGQTTARCDSSDNPTVTFGTPTAANATVPHRIGTFPQTSDVTIAYRNSSDSDLYTIKSTDDGATFGTAVNIFTGTVASADANLSRNSSGGFYVSGTRAVVGYIVNDNGTLKYNELYLNTPAAGAASGTGAAAAVSGANATGAASGVGVAQATGAQTAAAVGAATGIGAAAAEAYVPPVVSLRTVVSWVELSGTAAEEEFASGAGAASGVGAAAATGVALSVSSADGAASGVGAASAVGAQTAAAAGAASGTGTAQATGTQTAATVGSASGVGAALARGNSPAIGSAAGTSTAQATATWIAAAAGSAAGVGLLVGDSGGLAFGAGDAAGVGAASAIGRATASAVGAATGTGAAAAVGAAEGGEEVIVSAVGTASGVGSADGRSLEEQLPIAGGGGARFRPRPVVIEGIGYGVLPELVGFAIGEVGYRPKLIAGRAKGIIALGGHCVCDVGVKGAAYSIARLPLVASAVAAAGSAGQAEITLKICTGVAMGDHDPDEHVVIALMMAA